jgi:hypothetical protein
VARIAALFVVLLGVIGLAIAPRPAYAKAELSITKLELPENTSADLEKKLRKLLKQTASHLDFGKSKKVEVAIRLKEFTIETSDDLVRVTATLVGRLKGGGTARSHISFGAKPSKRKSLEKQVLKMVADSVLTRLAEMARVRDALDERKKKEAGSPVSSAPCIKPLLFFAWTRNEETTAKRTARAPRSPC